MDTISLILQGLVVLSLIAFLIERARERKKQREAELQAGAFLVEQVANAPKGATIILGAAKYRTRKALRICRDNITLQGAPEGTSQILVEGDNIAIEVTDAAGVQIRDMHIEMMGPAVRDTKDDPPLEGDVQIIIPDDPDGKVDIGEIMGRDYEMGGNAI